MLQLYLKDEGGRSWVKSTLDSSSLKYDRGSVLNVFPEMCAEGRHTKLNDFDDHLNDLSRLSPELTAYMQAISVSLLMTAQQLLWSFVAWLPLSDLQD